MYNYLLYLNLFVVKWQAANGFIQNPRAITCIAQEAEESSITQDRNPTMGKIVEYREII